MGLLLTLAPPYYYYVVYNLQVASINTAHFAIGILVMILQIANVSHSNLFMMDHLPSGPFESLG